MFTRSNSKHPAPNDSECERYRGEILRARALWSHGLVWRATFDADLRLLAVEEWRLMPPTVVMGVAVSGTASSAPLVAPIQGPPMTASANQLPSLVANEASPSLATLLPSAEARLEYAKGFVDPKTLVSCRVPAAVLPVDAGADVAM